MDISKTITEYLRHQYSVRASHARELSAAFLGYKSHAAYLALTAGNNWSFERVDVLIPNLDCLDNRIKTIANLPTLPNYRELAKAITDDLREQRIFRGTLILAKTLKELEDCMDDSYLRENITLEDQESISSEMAMSNNWFGYETYNSIKFTTTEDGAIVEASGIFKGEHDDESDRPNHGEIIDFEVKLEIKLMAWKVGFSQEIETRGKLQPHYV